MHILLALDGSADGNAGCDLLSQHPARDDDQVTVVVVTPPHHLPGTDLRAPAGGHGDAASLIASNAAQQLEEAGYQVTIELPHGKPAEEILRIGQSSNADLVVLGKKGLGTLRRLLLGSVAADVARLAASPVLLMTAPASFAQVLVVSDNSPESTRAAAIVLAIPAASLEHVTFLQVNRAGQTGNAIDEAFQQAASSLEESGVAIELIEATGNEVDVTLDRAETDHATLIVAAASDAMVGDEPVLGTTVHGLIDRAPCSLLIAR